MKVFLSCVFSGQYHIVDVISQKRQCFYGHDDWGTLDGCISLLALGPFSGTGTGGPWKMEHTSTLLE